MNVLSQRLRQTDAMIEDLLFLDVHGRVAKKLLDLAELHGVRTPEGIRIEMKLTQSDLAALVGASRESVNKVMGYFVDKRFISSEKRKITILRLAELRRRDLLRMCSRETANSLTWRGSVAYTAAACVRYPGHGPMWSRTRLGHTMPMKE